METKIFEINWEKFEYTTQPFFDEEGEALQVKCEALGMDMVYDLKYAKQDTIDWLHTFYENKRANQREWKKQLKVWSKTYQITFHCLGFKTDDKCWYRIVCKGAKYNKEHLSSDLEKVYNQILPHLLKAKQENEKTSPFQIRFTKSQREQISLLAEKEWVSISDLIIQKVLA